MKARSLIALAALACPAAAGAQPSELYPCDQAEVGLTSIAVGADLSGVRTYYRGLVTLMVLDQEEPACCAFGLAIVMPAPPGEYPVGMKCWATIGYAGVELRAARSSYDPRRGLTLTIPTRGYDPDTGGTIPSEPIRLRIDAARGTIADLSRR